MSDLSNEQEKQVDNQDSEVQTSTSEETHSTSKRRDLKTIVLFVVTVLVILLLDRVTKIWAATALSTSSLVSFIPGLLDFVLVYNTGASFGMMQGATTFFIICALVICVFLLGYLFAYKRHTLFEAFAMGLVLAGALGNVYDRIAFGKVTDFLSFHFMDFPVFNIADSAIVCGIILWAIYIIFSPSSPLSRIGERGDDDVR